MKHDQGVDRIWKTRAGSGPVIFTAVHDGHAARDEVAKHFALDDAERLREEDPFTGDWGPDGLTHVIGTRSRFQVDLNRPRHKAVYRTPDDAWGLTVWKDEPPEAIFERSLAEYDAFYAEMKKLFSEISEEHERFVVFDLHSYNHRRDGVDGPPADPEQNPQINIGTGSVDRQEWGPVIDTLVESLGSFDHPGGRLDVRENIKFQGGNWPRWINENFSDSGVAIAIEFKKFFMCEWSGLPDQVHVRAIEESLQIAASAVTQELTKL